MGIFDKFFNFSLEDPSQPLLPTSFLEESSGLGHSDAGMLVNQKQAMRYSTVHACVKIISQDLSRVNLEIFQTKPDGSKVKAITHRSYSLLHDRPNPNMSSMVWRSAMISSMLLWGNAYSFIKRDNAQRVIALIPLAAEKTGPTFVKDNAGNNIFMYGTRQTDTGEVTYIDPEDILHFMPFTLDGVTGVSPIEMCKNAIGLGLAQEKYGALFFGNGARSTGAYITPGTLDTEARENFKKSLREMATGHNALAPVLLEGGLDWKQFTIPPNEAQFIDGRKFSKEEIAQMFRVPLHLLQDLSKVNNNSLEFQGMDYTRSCLSPIAVTIEQEITYKILGGPFTCVHNLMDLQRGDFASLTTSLISLRNSGVYNANDVLKALNENPKSEDTGAEELIVNGTFQTLSSVMNEEGQAEDTEAPADTGEDTGNPAAYLRDTMLLSYRPLVRDAVGRTFARNGDPEFLKKAFQPIVNSMLQGLLASKYGCANLTKDDLDLIGSTVMTVVDQAHAWTKKDASHIATEITEHVYTMLTEKR